MRRRERGVFDIVVALSLLASLVLGLVVLYFYQSSSIQMSVKAPPEAYRESELLKLLDSTGALHEVIKQRNEISALLNDMRRQLGKMQCEQNTELFNKQGGWCETASNENSGHHKTDKKLIPVLSKFLAGKRVGSFGDGPGAYKREILKLGEVVEYDAYDGAPYSEETSKGLVKFLDLSVPQYGIPTYDWIISLEVGEHIPQQFEKAFFDNIFRHAKEGIILSWALPRPDKGLGHVNRHSVEYIVDLMKRNGFEIDMKVSRHLQSSVEFWWLKKTPHVYFRSGLPPSDYEKYA